MDIIDHGLEGLQAKELDYLEKAHPGITSDEAVPKQIEANVESVSLDTPPDLITSIEVIQYLNDPLAALANWYNQLSDNGVMVVSRSSQWSSSMRFENPKDTLPAPELLNALGQAGVKHAAVNEADSEGGVRPNLDSRFFKTLAIQKMPDTKMHLNAQPVTVYRGTANFKTIHYRKTTQESPIVIESLGKY